MQCSPCCRVLSQFATFLTNLKTEPLSPATQVEARTMAAALVALGERIVDMGIADVSRATYLKGDDK